MTIQRLNAAMSGGMCWHDNGEYVRFTDAEADKARAVAGAVSKATNHAESLRSIREILRGNPPDIARAILWCNDSLSGYVETHAESMVVLSDRVNEAEKAVAIEQEKTAKVQAELQMWLAKGAVDNLFTTDDGWYPMAGDTLWAAQLERLCELGVWEHRTIPGNSYRPIKPKGQDDAKDQPR